MVIWYDDYGGDLKGYDGTILFMLLVVIFTIIVIIVIIIIMVVVIFIITDVMTFIIVLVVMVVIMSMIMLMIVVWFSKNMKGLLKFRFEKYDYGKSHLNRTKLV